MDLYRKIIYKINIIHVCIYIEWYYNKLSNKLE